VRTTLDIRDDVLELVKEYAAIRSMSYGAAASEILEKGLKSKVGIRYESGFPVFDVPAGSPIVTLEQTLELEDEL
jgi:hypothetical protein